MTLTTEQIALLDEIGVTDAGEREGLRRLWRAIDSERAAAVSDEIKARSKG